jgi:D-sedoheptulose 7-phosphate isomerase
MDNIFIIGNGGSAATASHFAEDLAKGTCPTNAECFPKAIALTDNVPFITALGNDEGYQNVFIGQLRTLALEPDLLIAISVSGNSPNILNAVHWANERKLITFGLTGCTGGELASIASDCIQVPSDDFGIVESIHSFILHYIPHVLKEKWSAVN